MVPEFVYALTKWAFRERGNEIFRIKFDGMGLAAGAGNFTRGNRPMKQKLINDPYRNPFHNRFHVPVHSRLDEMQAYTNMAWLSENKLDKLTSRHVRHWGRALLGAFALLLLVVGSAAWLSN
jgi:hypothetical protein